MPESRGDKRQACVKVAVLRNLDKAVDLAMDGVEEEEEGGRNRVSNNRHLVLTWFSYTFNTF